MRSVTINILIKSGGPDMWEKETIKLSLDNSKHSIGLSVFNNEAAASWNVIHLNILSILTMKIPGTERVAI